MLVFTDLIRLRRDRGEDVGELLAEARSSLPDNKLLWWIEAAVHDLREGRYAEALALLDRLLAVDLATLPGEGPAYDAADLR